MTTDKAFKRVVRARMAKTGERYAAARRALVEGATDGHHAEPSAHAATSSGYRMRGGLHPETATLANVLANQGVVSGVTGEPLTEAAILGIGGGLGAGYILWEFQAEHRGKIHRGPVLTLAFRNQWQYPWIPGWTGKTLDRLGIEPDVHETGGAKGAREALDARLDAGVPVIAHVDLQSIGTWGQPDDLSGHFGLVVVVFGRDADGSYLVDDRGRSPFRVSPPVMAAARGRIGSFKHRIVGLRTTPGPIPAERLREAMRAGLEDQVDHLRSGSDSFSLPAWRKWARLMTDERNAKAWPRVFADGQGLFGSLSAIHESVDGQVGPWGGHLRELYAASLDEAAVVLENPALGEAARAWRGVADRWEELADAAVPPDLDGAAEAVEAVETLHEAVMAGEPGRSRVVAAAETAWAIRDRFADSFPLPPDRVDAILEDLGGRIAAIHEAEVDALAMTARA
ncbi:MAG TPA: BtrH N-terminal domain-containing protein, partial [Candidatus Limnocylindria bacterium]